MTISSGILDMSLFIKKKKNQIFFSLLSHLCDLVGKGSLHTPNCDVFDVAMVHNNSLSTLNLVSHHIHEGPVPKTASAKAHAYDKLCTAACTSGHCP